MKPEITRHRLGAPMAYRVFILSSALVCSSANASLLNASGQGTFTMNLDRAALAPYFGYFLSTFWNTEASDPGNPVNTGNYLVSHLNTGEISAVNRVFNLTAIGTDPDGQAGQRFVKATSAHFSLESDTFEGVPGARIGMTGVQGFYAPDWPPNGGGLVNGDFSLSYQHPSDREAVWNESGFSGRSSGWTLLNNIFFTMPVYDLSHLNIVFNDADNWQFSGDLLMSPENGGMLRGASLNDVGDFCLGMGSYSGCGQVSEVPLPTSGWLYLSTLLVFAGSLRHKLNKRALSLR